jgi:hypothetical protein
MLGLRFDADIRTLGFLATYVGLLVFMWKQHDNAAIGSVIWFVLWWALTFMSFTGAVATHNTIHCKMFHSTFLNTLMRFSLTLWYGHPCSTFVPGHNLSHHKYTQMVNDLMQTSIVQHKPNIYNLFLFHPAIVKGVMKSDIRYMLWMGKQQRRMFSEWLAEGVVLILVTLWLVLASPSRWLFYFMAPHYVAQFAIVTINLLQHDGCDVVLPREEDANPPDGDLYADHVQPTLIASKQIIAENSLAADIAITPPAQTPTIDSTMAAKKSAASTPTRSAASKATSASVESSSIGARAPTYQQRTASFNTARNFVSPTLNYLLMNNGYHTIHHHKPFLHWSLLKEAHEREVKPHMDSRLDQPSLWGYLFNQYVYPGIRTDYKGEPVVFDRTPEQSACGDWMNMPTDMKVSIENMTTMDRLQFVADGVVVMLLKLVSPMYSPFAAKD